ncbi:DUF6600 domain-containing protein [Methyloceanibacter sp.]|uniref:DUF6600 domain-containing protein n=1 Tax=Methyloceanibacter sp. TaxID=1965321 RepID=UPI003D6C9388
MKNRHWPRLLLAALVWAALLAAPGLPLPGADRLGVGGQAVAQESIDIDTFYDELAPYGQWVWHPRFGYVWLPETVSDNWRPYTVGRWTYTDEYGWYWDSYEPFAWAVYHYGRWGYDPDYGWFWVPGDTWAPAWVQWRYSDDYVGWAPIGPGRPGYAYGVPVNYDPPIAESWVFVQPRYLTSRAISHYALPIGGLSVAFFGATRVYRPQYRGGIVYNYGMPRDLVVKITRRPIYGQKVYRVNNWKGGRFDNNGPNKGIKIYAPHFSKDNRPNRGPKKFADNPNEFRPKAKLKDTFKGDVPKGWGPSAKGVKSIAKEDPDAFKKKHDFDGRDFGDRGKNNDRDSDRNNDKGQASKDFDRYNRGKDNKNFDNQGGVNQFKQGNRDDNDKGDKSDNNKNRKNGGNGNANNDARTPPPPTTPPPIQKVIRDQDSGSQATTDAKTQTERTTIRRDEGGNNDNNQTKNKNKNKNFGDQGAPNQFKQGNRDNSDQGGGSQRKQKDFGEPGGPGGPGGIKQFNQGGSQGGGQAQGDQGGGGGGDKKCQKHPEKPECQGRN